MGIVYKIVDEREPDVVLYVGSTVQSLHSRWRGHIVDFKRRYCPLYEHMREVGGIEYFEPIELARFNCTTKELREHEQTYIDKLSPKLNKIRAIRRKYNKAKHARCASLQRIRDAALLAQASHLGSATGAALRSAAARVHSLET